MKKVKFAFEDLEVWQKAVDFVDKVISLAEEMQTDRKHFRLIEQLESASTSEVKKVKRGRFYFLPESKSRKRQNRGRLHIFLAGMTTA